MKFVCSSCEYTSFVKENVVRHTNRKNKCGKNPVLLSVQADIMCDDCGKKFSTKCSLDRHISICKVRKDIDEKIRLDNEKRIKDLEEELKIQKALASKPTITIQNSNINITSYQRPNLRNIDEFLEECSKRQFMCIPQLIEMVHFNEDLPENHNLYLSNYRSNTMKAFNGKKWQTDEVERIVNNLINTYERDLEEWAGNDPDRLRHIENWNKIKRRDGEEVIYADLKKEIRKLMYDNRDMIKPTK